MNKIFTKVATLSIGLALAVGVGVAVGSKTPAKAEAETTYRPTGPRLFKLSQIESGKKYYIGATLNNTNDWYLSANGSTEGEVYGTPVQDASTASIFVASGSVADSTGTFNFKFDGTSNYLSNSSTGGKINVSSTAFNWTITENKGLFVFSDGSKYLSRNSNADTKRFGCYGSGQTNVWLQEVTDDDNTDYIITSETWNEALPTSSDSAFSNTATSVKIGSGSTQNVSFAGAGIYKSGSGSTGVLVIRNGYYLYNSGTFDSNDIISITLLYAGTAGSSKIGVYFGETASDVSTRSTASQVSNTGQYTIHKFLNSTSGIKYFQLSASSANIQLSQIVVTTGTIQSYTLDSTLVVTGSPSITTYYANQVFNPTGLTVKESYNNGAYIPDVNIADKVVWGSLIAGSSTVTGTYTNDNSEQATCTISGLTVTAYPTTNVQEVGTISMSTADNISGTPTEESLVYAKNPVVLNIAKSESSTAANAWYGGDASGHDHTRIYNKAVVTISVTSPYKLGNLEFTATSDTYANYLAAAVGTNCTLKASGTTVYVYPVPESTSISITIASATRVTAFDAVVFGPEIGSIPVESVGVNPTTKTISAYEKFTISATVLPINADDTSVTWSSSDDDVATVEGGVVTGVAAGQATITARTNGEDVNGNHLTASCTVTVTAFVQTHVKVTNVNQLHNGAKVVIASADGTAVAKAHSGTDSNLKAGKAIFKTDKSAISNEEGGEFTVWCVDSTNNKYVLSSSDSYLAAKNGASSSRYLKNNIKIDDTSLLSITITDGVATIKPHSDGDSLVRFNAGSSVFSSYASGQSDVALYVNTTSALSSQDLATAFEDVFMKMNTIDEDDKGTGLCKTNGYYTYAKDAYVNDLGDAKTYLSADAKERLSAWADANEESFDPTEGTFTAKQSGLLLLSSAGSNTSIAVIIVAVIVGIAAIGGYFLFKKKER